MTASTARLTHTDVFGVTASDVKVLHAHGTVLVRLGPVTLFADANSPDQGLAVLADIGAEIARQARRELLARRVADVNAACDGSDMPDARDVAS